MIKKSNKLEGIDSKRGNKASDKSVKDKFYKCKYMYLLYGRPNIHNPAI